MKPIKSVAATLAAFTLGVEAGPLGYGACQAGCAAVVMACYSAAGFTWGATRKYPPIRLASPSHLFSFPTPR